MKGVGLLETIVVIATIAFLSTIGANSFINIKNDAEIDAITDELISDIKLARNKSMNGELLESETTDTFNTDGLPEYGISIFANSYKIIRQCIKADATDCSSEDLSVLEDFKVRNINPQYTLDTNVSDDKFYFDRITGKIDSTQTITIKEKNDKYKRNINISDNFVITVNE